MSTGHAPGCRIVTHRKPSPEWDRAVLNPNGARRDGGAIGHCETTSTHVTPGASSRRPWPPTNHQEAIMKRMLMMVSSLAGLVLAAVLISGLQGPAQGAEDSQSRIQQGFAIAPVPLDLRGKNLALVGLGSYIVNAQSVCADCHSCPTYA